MMNVVPSLVRRGFEAHAAAGDKQYNIPTWGALMLISTTILFFGVMFSIEYTFGRLLPTLLIIESPAEAISFEPLATEDPDSTIKDPEQMTNGPQYITASFRRTVRHLQAVGGFRARFRGFSVFVVTALLVNWIAGMISILPFIPRGLSNVIAAVICAQLSLAWTHIVISEPSPKTWFRRLPPMTTWRKVAGPTAVLAIAEQLSILLPFYLAIVSGLGANTPEELANLTPHQKTVMSLKGFGIAAFGLVLAFLIVIPANVTLTRVQASLLPDAEETIVPFDRSFNGKVIPEIVGGSGVISMLDAWKTFDWAARVRLVKAYAKVWAMQVGVTVLFTVCIISQLFIIVGKDWSKLIPEDGDKN